MLLTLPMAGCGMTPTTGTVSTTPPRYILCSLDPPISYAAAKAGEQDTAANTLDTDATIGNPKTRGTIRYHNAVVKAACGG